MAMQGLIFSPNWFISIKMPDPLRKNWNGFYVEWVLVYDAEHIKIKWKFDDVFAALMGNG